MSTPFSTLPSNVVELRRYTLHPGQRDTLIELFDTEFIKPQEALGIAVLGQFRDDDHPDTFTWFRGFTDMTSRRSALEAFYGGPSWAKHRDAANATMVDSENVLLLAPVPGQSFSSFRPSPVTPQGHCDVVTLHLEAPASAVAISAVSRAFASDRLIALLVTLDAVNDFPVLPVRERENVIVAVVARESPDDERMLKFETPALGPRVLRTDVFRLTPTGGSRLR